MTLETEESGNFVLLLIMSWEERSRGEWEGDCNLNEPCTSRGHGQESLPLISTSPAPCTVPGSVWGICVCQMNIMNKKTATSKCQDTVTHHPLLETYYFQTEGNWWKEWVRRTNGCPAIMSPKQMLVVPYFSYLTCCFELVFQAMSHHIMMVS